MMKKLGVLPAAQQEQNGVRGRAGIEPATSRTRSENHTTRPTALYKGARRSRAQFTPGRGPVAVGHDTSRTAPRVGLWSSGMILL